MRCDIRKTTHEEEKRKLFLQDMRNAQRAMTKRKQQREEMKWSLEEPSIQKRCLARELSTKTIIKEMALNVIS
jgi:hypothetical protein